MKSPHNVELDGVSYSKYSDRGRAIQKEIMERKIDSAMERVGLWSPLIAVGGMLIAVGTAQVV